VYGLHDGEECRNEQQRAINIYFGKSVGRERMHRGFLSGQQGLSVH